MSQEQYERAISERYYEFQQKLEAVIAAYGRANADAVGVRKAASALMQAGEDLLRITPKADRPSWLSSLTAAASMFSQGKSEPNSLLRAILAHQHEIKPIVIADTKGMDFDAVYKRLRDEGKLVQLFDAMIRAIEQMIQSDEIENTYVLRSLRRLLDLLRANRDGSYLAAVATFNSAVFLKRTALGFLKKIPGVDVLAEAFEAAVNDAEVELKKIEDGFLREAIHTLLDDKTRQKLEHLATPRISGPAPAIEATPPEDVEDAEFTPKPD